VLTRGDDDVTRTDGAEKLNNAERNGVFAYSIPIIHSNSQISYLS